MATAIFPEVVGVSWDVHLKPQFSTKISVHTSGRETRTAFWEQPVYDIELVYDYLPNYDGTNTDMKKVLGFFLERMGAFEEFLYKMKDFNHVDDRSILVGNGTINEVVLTDKIYSYEQPIGQVNPDTLAVKIHLAPQAVQAGVDAVLQLPYPDSAVIASVVRASHTYLPVSGTPVGYQYNFDSVTGQLTFPIGEASQTFTITYVASLLPTTGYSILQPNTLVFTTSPPAASIVTAAYDYWFIVRFTEDQQDFDTFSEKLWELQQLNLRSVIV